MRFICTKKICTLIFVLYINALNFTLTYNENLVFEKKLEKKKNCRKGVREREGEKSNRNYL